MDRPTDVRDILQALQLNCAVNAQIRARAFRQRSVQRNVHGYGAIFDRRINANDMAGNDAIARVYFDGLIQLHVPRLRLRDFDRRL